MLVAVSPPIFTVAVRVVPHEKPSAKCVHSASVPPAVAGGGGREPPSEPSALFTIRTPYEPVSSSTLLTVTQLVVEFGAQMLTLTVGMLMMFDPPLFTVIGTVLAAFAAIGCWFGPLVPPPL